MDILQAPLYIIIGVAVVTWLLIVVVAVGGCRK